MSLQNIQKNFPDFDEKKQKEALKYIREAYPEVYGSRTVIEIRPYLTEQEIADNSERNIGSQSMNYRFQVPNHMKAKDNRVPHYRSVTTDGLVLFWDKLENRPQNINRFGLKKGEVKTFDIDLNQIQGLYMLAFWIEHPLVKVYGMENQFCTTSPIFEMRIRGNVIKHDWELVNENYAIGQEILQIALSASSKDGKNEAATMELVNMASFLGMETVGLTAAELVIGLLGKKMDGKAYQERVKYRRYQALGADERDLEIALAKAIEYKFIQDTGNEGWKMDDGTLLGADRGQVLAYLREKKAAFNKLMDRVRVHAEKAPSISDVEELVSDPSDGVRQTKPLREAKKTAAPTG